MRILGFNTDFDGWIARLPVPPPGRRNLFERICRFQFAATRHFRRVVPNLSRAAWLRLSLFLLTAVLCCQTLPGAMPTNGYEFPQAIAKPGSLQWETNLRLSRQRQEIYRPRLSLPSAITGNVPRAEIASLTLGQNIMAAPALTPSNSSGGFLQSLLIAGVALFMGAAIVRRISPDLFAELSRLLNPWSVAPLTRSGPAGRILAEEEALGEFLATFRTGPAAGAPARLPAEDDPLLEFYARTKTRLAAQRKLIKELGEEMPDPARRKILTNLYFEMGVLKDEAVFSEALPVWQVASALKGLLKQLNEKMRNVTPSTLRTVSGGLDLLDNLCLAGLKLDLLSDRPLRFLVVDDDLISRQALSLSLKNAFSQPDLAIDGESALTRAIGQAYDVIFLDVQLPGMDGFELCTKIHDTVLNRTTPVVFVTGQNDFDARAKSTFSGGSDLMGKPFLIFEVTVKALTLALQARLQAGTEPVPVNPRPIPAPPVSPFVGADRARPVAGLPLVRPPTAIPLPVVREEAVMAFLGRAAKNLGPLQDLCETILQTPDKATRQTMLADGFMLISALISKAEPLVHHPAYQMAGALDGLFRKLLQDSNHSTPSTLATVATAVDLLNDLCVPGLKADLASNPPIQLLVVDDDLVARRAIAGALQTALNKPESVENGEAALALALEKHFDVIFLDVQMPGMDGFQVCSKIRETVPNRTTPIVFVTGHGEFDARVQMSCTGGNDLMGKPFLTAEITVKALTFALRGRLQNHAPLPAPANVAVPVSV